MPNANDDPATMHRKLTEAQRWASDKAQQISPAAANAAGQRTGLPTGDIPTVTTPAEAAKLKPGTQFRTPDGQVRVRQ